MISNGQIADANEVKPTLYGQFRDLIEKDKYAMLSRAMYMNNFIVDGFVSSNWVASSTGWNSIGVGGWTSPQLYWTTTNASDLIGKTSTFPSTISFGTGYVDYWICETIDECNSSGGTAINASVWDVITDGEESTQTYDGSGNLALVAQETSGSGTNAQCQVRTDNAVFDSTHRYLAMKFSFSAGNSGGTSTTDSNSIEVGLHDGTDLAVMFSVSGGNSFTTSLRSAAAITTLDSSAPFWHGDLRPRILAGGSTGIGTDYTLGSQSILLEAIYNPDASMVDVFLCGLYYKSVSVSAVSPIKLNIDVNAQRTAGGGTPLSQTTFSLDWVRREKASPASSLAFNMSANNGSNYTSIGHETETAIANTGTQVKPKLTATISGSEYIHVRGYAALLR